MTCLPLYPFKDGGLSDWWSRRGHSHFQLSLSNCCSRHAATPVTDCRSVCLAESGSWPHGHGHLNRTCMCRRRDYAHVTQCHCLTCLNTLACHCDKPFVVTGMQSPYRLGLRAAAYGPARHVVDDTCRLWIKSFIRGSQALLG